MPFKSVAQQKFAFATHQPWAKEWASKTNFSKIPARVGSTKKLKPLKGIAFKFKGHKNG